MILAYLINQYPQTSQAFIRREIRALEELGHTVHRFTVRTWDQEVVDEGDKTEKAKTRVVLGVGGLGLLGAVLKILFTRPGAFFRALRLAFKMGKGGERGRLYHLIYLAEACVLLSWLSELSIEHVHAHFGTNSATVAMLLRELGGPGYSFTCHGPEEFDRPVALKLGEKISRAAFVVAVSEYGRSQLFRWCGHEHWHKVHVVHCGLDRDFLGIETPPVPDVAKLVCVGRLCEQKGQLLLVQAAAMLREEQIPFEIVLVGDGPMRKEIEALIDRNGLAGCVTITGWMSNAEVREQILSARALVLPSFAEGLPVVIMEALALGRPVVSTYVAGIPELVEAGNCGYLVPSGSVRMLAHALRNVLGEDVKRLREMGARGAARVRERHDATVEAGKLADLFKAVAERREKDLSYPFSDQAAHKEEPVERREVEAG